MAAGAGPHLGAAPGALLAALAGRPLSILRECSPVVTHVRGIEVLARNIFFSILLQVNA
jgi:hypothetical protein